MKKVHQWLLISLVVVSTAVRLPALDRVPPALYSDEISQGYNAYSILKTGHDEYGTYWPMSFRSFGDWKPPLQTYVMLPSVALFGLNAWGVRLPGAILGVLTVVTMYFFTLRLLQTFAHKKQSNTHYNIALLSALLLTLSPWHILQSRSAMLVAVSLFFYLTALWCFLKGLDKKIWWMGTSICFVLAIYGYYGMRLIVPYTLILLIVFFGKQIWFAKKAMCLALIIGILGLAPLLLAFISEPNVLFGRAKTVSILYDQSVTLRTWELIAADGVDFNSTLVQFFHYRPFAYFADIIRRFWQHLDLRFLVVQGDLNPPFQIPQMGIMYGVDILFILVGLRTVWKYSRKLFGLIVGLGVISIFPAAFTYVTPASNRTLTLLLPLLFLGAVGVNQLIHRKGKWVVILLGSVYIGSFAYFSYQYFLILPVQHADWWHFGYKELFSSLKKEESDFDTISISSHASVPYIFYLFYNQVDPRIVPEKVVRNFKPDNFGFEHVAGFGEYQFLRYFDWKVDKDRIERPSIIAVMGNESLDLPALEKKQIHYPNGTVAFRIYWIPPP